MADLHTKPLPETRVPGNFLSLGERLDEAESGLVAATAGDRAGADLVESALFRRAVEAAIWGVPLVNFHALRQAYFSDASAQLHDVLFWPEPAGWRFQAPSPDPSARHVLFFVSVADGPIVIEIPSAGKAELSGTLIDSWNLPLADVGPDGADKGKGAKYLLLPPEHEARHAQGFLPLKAATHNIYGLLRLTPKSDSDEDVDEAIAHLKQLRIYPLSGGGPTRKQRFIEMTHRKFEGTIAWDVGFFAALARMVTEEPVKRRDQTMMGLLHSIGIDRTQPFQADDGAAAVFARAIAEAHAFMIAGRASTGAAPWPDRRWKSRALVGGAFVAGDRVLVDERAVACFGSFGLRRQPRGDRHFETFYDERSEPLNGSRAYRLSVPAALADSTWSVAAYDSETNAFVREAPAAGSNSRDPTLARNDDGSVDLHFAPQPPRSRGTNWIATAEGRPFFLVFRLRASEGGEPAWSLGDVEPVS
jgi:hypothetical protein